MKKKIHTCKGLSYLEVVVSLGIMMGFIQIVGMGIYHTVTSYQNLKEVEKATSKGKEFIQDVGRILEKSDTKEVNLLKEDLKNKGEEQNLFEYQYVLIEDLEPGMTVGWEQIEQGIHFTLGQPFELDLFKKLYEDNQLMIYKTRNKETQLLYYEGIKIQSTPEKIMTLKTNTIVEQQRVIIDSEIILGDEGATVKLYATTMGLNPSRPIVVIWEGIEYLSDKTFNVEWVNETPCNIILGLVGEPKEMESIRFNIGEESKKMVVKYFEKTPYEETSYLLIGAVIKKDKENSKVLKTYLTMQ